MFTSIGYRMNRQKRGERPIRIAFFLLSFISLFWQISFSQEDRDTVKIGVVDTHELLERYANFVDINEVLDKELSSLFEPIRKKERELIELQETLREVGNEEEERTLERSISSLQRELERMSDDFRQEANLRRNEELYKIQKTINDAILRFANKNGYDLIMEYGLLYSKEELNITEKILDELIPKPQNSSELRLDTTEGNSLDKGRTQND